jgi:hypothetical protein
MQKRLSLCFTLLAAVLVAGCAVKDPKDPRFVVAEGKGIKVTRAQLDGEVDRALLNFNLSRDKVPAPQLNSLEMNILNQMINRQVALEEARKSPLTNAAVLAKEQLEKMASGKGEPIEAKDGDRGKYFLRMQRKLNKMKKTHEEELKEML